MKKWSKIIVGAIFVIFAAQSFFYAFDIRPGTYPDENYHSGLAFLWAHSEDFFLQNSEKTHFFRNVERIPFLYHAIGGLWISLNIFPVSDFYFLRILSVLLALGTVLFSLGIFRILTKNPIISILALVFLTNFLFFSYFSAAISYDSLINLCAAGMIFFFLRFFQKAHFWNFFGFSLFLIIGSLTKNTFLPLSAFVGILFLALFFRKETRKDFFQDLFSQKIFWFFSFFILSLTAFMIFFYGKNIIDFGRPIPHCNQIMSHEECLKNYMYRREFKRINELKIVNNYHFDPFGYLLEWTPLVFDRLTGIVAFQRFCKNEIMTSSGFFSHENAFFAQTQIYPSSWTKKIFQILFFFSLFSALFSFFAFFTKTKLPWKKEVVSLEILFSGLILLFYGGIIFWVNYSIYSGSGSLHLALHGRYLLPILPILSFFLAFFLLCHFQKKTQIALSVLVALFLIGQNFPSFFIHKDHERLLKNTDWIPPTPCNISQNICHPLDPDEWKFCESENMWQYLKK